MTTSHRRTLTGATRLLLAGVLATGTLLTAAPAQAQLPRDPVERAKVIAQIFEANASQLTLFDRAGKEVARVGPRAMYDRPVLSPDGKRLVVIKGDLDKETRDIWVIDVATGEGKQLTNNQPRESAATPTWSPDGSQVAYVSLRTGTFGLFRRPADGTGAETLLYKSSGPIDLTDWSMDGRFLSFYRADLAGSALYSLPLDGPGEKQPIELARSTFRLQGPRISPDGKLALYVANPTGRLEAYVRPFDAANPAATASAQAIQVSDQGSIGMAYWRRDGKELFYLTPNRTVMVVDVSTSPKLEFSKPRVLFSLGESTPFNASQAGMSRDGERVVIAVPPPQLRQLTLLDRTGKPVRPVGPPGLYGAPALSPDGTRLVVTKNNPDTGYGDLWTFDLATGQGKELTHDQPPDFLPVWSADSKQIAYVSTRGQYSGIYRRAADGTGSEQLLFRYTPGAGIALSDWSEDGKFLTFATGVIVVVPLEPAVANPVDRKEIDWLQEDYEAFLGRFSPDTRHMAYLANQVKVDVMQVYVRPFDASKPEKPGPGAAVQISTNANGVAGMLSWRQDGKELYYMTRDFEVMAVEITTTPTLQASAPKLLFKMPVPVPGAAQGEAISADGQHFVVSLPVTANPTR
jgi:Tol biopolymer transport system component